VVTVKKSGGYHKLWSLSMEGSHVVVNVKKKWRISQVVVLLLVDQPEFQGSQQSQSWPKSRQDIKQSIIG
jgi:hypothetical protein